MSSPPERRKPGLLAALATVLLVGVGIYFHWRDHYVEVGLERWAVGEVARRTDSAYTIVLGHITFRPLLGSLSFDSATVATNAAMNRRRRTPLPTLHALMDDCRLTGVDVPRIFFRKSFDAQVLGCRRVTASIRLPPPSHGRMATADSIRASPRDTVPDRPLGLSLFRIAEISFPALSFTLRRPGPNGGASVILETAQLHVANLTFNPTADPHERHMVTVRQARIAATRLMLRPDTLSQIAIARLQAGITDSTLGLAVARHEPSMTDEEWVRHQKFRHDRIRFALDSFEARGVAYRTLITTGDIAIRAIDVRGARLDVLSDKRLPPGPPRQHRSPQQVAAAASPDFRVDTIHISRSHIAYNERKADRERAGHLSFDSVRGTIHNLHLPSRGKPLRMEAGARFMNAGLMSVHATVPLDGRDFRFSLKGTLGPMPAAVINEFLAETEPIDLKSGQVDGVEFEQVAVGGRATTRLTPRYRQLKVEGAGHGGGAIGAVKRATIKFVANTFKVRSENPENHETRIRTATTTRTYDPTNSWVQFLWFGLRDGLKVVIVK